MNNKYLPSISIVIATKNNERTLGKLLQDIKDQDYSKDKLETIIVDGRSTDKTLKIIRKIGFKTRVYQAKFPNDPEICKGEGISYSKSELVLLLDSDNYLPSKNWIKNLVAPLIEDNELVGSYTTRFKYVKKDNYLNRYFALIGSADPVGLYLGKADRMSYVSEKWTGFGKLVKETKKYFVIVFNGMDFPTLGSNGFLVRRKILANVKSDPPNFFHIDVPFDLAKKGYGSYALVKGETGHDTAAKFIPYLIKRVNYVKLHYQKRAKDRRYKVFDPNRKEDLLRITLFIIFSLTIIQPLYISIKGFSRTRDWVWFVHPLFCFAIVITYAIAILQKRFIK